MSSTNGIKLFATIFACGVCISLSEAVSKMETVYSWKVMDFAFPNDSPRESYISTGQYIPENIIALDVSVWGGHTEKKKVFVTTPRFRKGTPATLSLVSSKIRNGSPLLAPYPDWSWHRQGDCNGITSVFRTAVDECGRLWVADTGFLHSENKQICPPQLLVFNLYNDQLLGRYVFPKDVVDKDTLLVTTTVDTRGPKCSDTFVYMADVVNFKLIVFDAVNQKSWKVDSNMFYPYPLNGVFNINGVTFDLMDGLFGLALGPMINNNRMLYFHSLASVRESWVQTCIVRNESLFVDGQNLSPRSFKVSEGTRSSQAAAQDMTDNGILFFGLVQENAIACWNSKRPYKKENIEIVSKDDVRLQFASGLKVHNNKVWAFTCRFQNYYTGIMNPDEINFRVSVGSVRDLVQGTSCETSHSPYKPSYNRPSGSYTGSGGSYNPILFEE